MEIPLFCVLKLCIMWNNCLKDSKSENKKCPSFAHLHDVPNSVNFFCEKDVRDWQASVTIHFITAFFTTQSK